MKSPLKIYRVQESSFFHFINISLPNHIKDHCYDFAIDVTNTTYKKYKERSPLATKKQLIELHYAGKLAEYAVAKYLIEYSGFSMSVPDTKVYSIEAKTYEPDLRGTGLTNQVYTIHVKNQPFKFNRNGSDDFDWLVQDKEPFINAPEPNELMAFTFMNADESVGIYKIANAKDVQFDEPYGNVLYKKRIMGYNLFFFTPPFSQ